MNVKIESQNRYICCYCARHLHIFFNPRDVSHAHSSSSIPQPYISSSSSTPHHQQQYEQDRKRRKSAHSVNSSSLHRRTNVNIFSNQPNRPVNDLTPENHINSCRGKTYLYPNILSN